jgi:hypothetical protein
LAEGEGKRQRGQIASTRLGPGATRAGRMRICLPAQVGEVEGRKAVDRHGWYLDGWGTDTRLASPSSPQPVSSDAILGLRAGVEFL